MRKSNNRHGFTLVEVAIATLVLAFACLVVLMLLPGAMRAQQQSRYSILAALHAQNLLEGFYRHDIDLAGTSLHIHPALASGKDPQHDRMFGFDQASDTYIANQLTKKKRMLGPLGDYDLENMVGGRILGNYPVPTSIARRLDSPGDEIQKILDAGGYIYYCDPLQAGRLDAKIRKAGASENNRGDMQKLVWGIVGDAQQNVLPYNPMAIPYTEVYPFPPQSRPRAVDRIYQGSYTISWERDGQGRTVDNVGGIDLDNPRQVQRWRKVLTGYNFKAIDVLDDGPSKDYVYGKQEVVGYQSNAWEWFAETEAGSPWERGIECYRRLVNAHWLRIQAQIDHINLKGQGSASLPTTSVTIPGTRTEEYIVTDGQGDVVRDDDGRPVVRTRQVPSGVKVETKDGDIVETVGANASSTGTDRGYPTPANGVGWGHLQGTDILEEDAAAHVKDLANQIRIGMPSLERRIMYRTAALRLWAKAYRNIDICSGDDPNVATNISQLQDRDNPLTDAFVMPEPQDWHPALVLASSYLSHASMMVTGYKPPFYDTRNTPSAHDDIPLLRTDGDDATSLAWETHTSYGVPYEHLPYRAVEATCLSYQDAEDQVPGIIEVLLADGNLAEVAIDLNTGVMDFSGIRAQMDASYFDSDGELRDVDGQVTSTPVVIDPDVYTYLWNPYHDDVMDAGTTTPHREESGALTSTANKDQYQVDNGNAPVMYRRMAGGLLNQFPPPYADRGAFGMDGVRTYDIRWQLTVHWTEEPVDPANPNGAMQEVPQYRLIRKVVSGDMDEDDLDSRWAHNAHKNALHMAMVYTADNPYDISVPKPLNRQRMTDRGLFQYDLFNSSGKARRPDQLAHKARLSAFYPLNSPVDRQRAYPIRFGPQGAFPRMMDSYKDWQEWDINEVMPTKRDGGANSSMLFGVPMRAGKVNDPLAIQRAHMKTINRLHGWPSGEAVNKATTADPSRFHATRAFQAQDRMRQIVYWLVDWMQYEDAESAPSAAVDFSRLRQQGRKVVAHIRVRKQEGPRMWDAVWYDESPKDIPDTFKATCIPTGKTVTLRHVSNGGKIYRYPPDAPEDTEYIRNYLDGRLDKPYLFKVEMHLPATSSGNDSRFLRGNPEEPFCWLDPERTATRLFWDEGKIDASMTARVDGGSLYSGIAKMASGHRAVAVEPLRRFQGSFGGKQVQYGITEEALDKNPFWALGAFGADRDGNGTFTSGPVPRSNRMQATEITRVNFYDPVSWISLGR